MTTTLGPIPIRVVRHACPHCGRTHARPGRAREHMARCWRNPEAKGCKTCKHFTPQSYDNFDECSEDVDLTGRPLCARCGGYGDIPGEGLGMTECPECAGDGAEIKPGPIVGCDRWEPGIDCRKGTTPCSAASATTEPPSPNASA